MRVRPSKRSPTLAIVQDRARKDTNQVATKEVPRLGNLLQSTAIGGGCE